MTRLNPDKNRAEDQPSLLIGSLPRDKKLGGEVSQLGFQNGIGDSSVQAYWKHTEMGWRARCSTAGMSVGTVLAARSGHWNDAASHRLFWCDNYRNHNLPDWPLVGRNLPEPRGTDRKTTGIRRRTDTADRSVPVAASRVIRRGYSRTRTAPLIACEPKWPLAGAPNTSVTFENRAWVPPVTHTVSGDS